MSKKKFVYVTNQGTGMIFSSYQAASAYCRAYNERFKSDLCYQKQSIDPKFQLPLSDICASLFKKKYTKMSMKAVSSKNPIFKKLESKLLNKKKRKG